MILFTKILIAFVLFLPALVLTGIVWIFGGWRDGFDYMPNPVYALIGWID